MIARIRTHAQGTFQPIFIYLFIHSFIFFQRFGTSVSSLRSEMKSKSNPLNIKRIWHNVKFILGKHAAQKRWNTEEKEVNWVD